MPSASNAVGKKFGRWTVLSEPAWAPERRAYLCRVRCECGAEAMRSFFSIANGGSNSCGCGRRKPPPNKTHGETGTPLFRIWVAMRRRCKDEGLPQFRDYGGRGIKVCKSWDRSFVVFRDWARANGYREGLTVERKDVDGDYRPANVRWIPLAEQAGNKRTTFRITAFGETKSLAAWSRDERCVVPQPTLQTRLRHLGWSAEEALTTPRTHKSRRGRPTTNG